MEKAVQGRTDIHGRWVKVEAARENLVERAEKMKQQRTAIAKAREAGKTARANELLADLEIRAIDLTMEVEAVADMIYLFNDAAKVVGRTVDALPSTMLGLGSECRAFVQRTRQEMRLRR